MKIIYKNKTVRIFSLGMVLAAMVSLSIFIQSCSSEDDFPELTIYKSERMLNLTAPNGEKIADNILQLKNIVAVSVAEKFGTDKEFYITDIEYMPMKEGYSVLIKYKTLDNIIGGIIRTNKPELVTIAPDLKVRIITDIRLKNGSESAVFNGKTYTCKDLGSCTCIPTFKTTGGVVEYSCGNCDNCELTIT